MQISVRSQTAAQTTLSWQPVAGAARYRILWSDRPGETVRFKTAGESGESLFTFCRSTHIPYYIKVQALAENGALLEESTPVQTPVGRVLQQQLEALDAALAISKELHENGTIRDGMTQKEIVLPSQRFCCSR